jgi:hypothetical protein
MLWVQKVIPTVIVDLQVGDVGGVDGSRALTDTYISLVLPVYMQWQINYHIARNISGN